jgi:hypothetical protein
MNLDEFLLDVNPSLIVKESIEEEDKDTLKLIKNLGKTRFNMLFKNLDRISQYMSSTGAIVRGAVKKTILNGAFNLFKQSRERSSQYQEKKKEYLDNIVDTLYKSYKLDQPIAGVIETVEFERMKFERVINQISEAFLPELSNNQELTFFTTEFLKVNMLESTEEKKYYENSRLIIEYFVVQSMLYRTIFACIQYVMKNVVSKIRLSGVEDANAKSKEVGNILVKFLKNEVSHLYGTAVGKYFSSYIDGYYKTSDDQKDQFNKFDNLVNILLGVKIQ